MHSLLKKQQNLAGIFFFFFTVSASAIKYKKLGPRGLASRRQVWLTTACRTSKQQKVGRAEPQF